MMVLGSRIAVEGAVVNVVRTTITFEVLHEVDLPVQEMDLSEIYYECMEGGASYRELSVHTSEVLTEAELRTSCDVHGTDVEFFSMGEEDE